MRGKDAGSTQATNYVRITPAYAGKSRIKDVEDYIKRDHPRVCGEKTKKIP